MQRGKINISFVVLIIIVTNFFNAVAFSDEIFERGIRDIEKEIDYSLPMNLQKWIGTPIDGDPNAGCITIKPALRGTFFGAYANENEGFSFFFVSRNSEYFDEDTKEISLYIDGQRAYIFDVIKRNSNVIEFLSYAEEESVFTDQLTAGGYLHLSVPAKRFSISFALTGFAEAASALWECTSSGLFDLDGRSGLSDSLDLSSAFSTHAVACRFSEEDAFPPSARMAMRGMARSGYTGHQQRDWQIAFRPPNKLTVNGVDAPIMQEDGLVVAIRMTDVMHPSQGGGRLPGSFSEREQRDWQTAQEFMGQLGRALSGPMGLDRRVMLVDFAERRAVIATLGDGGLSEHIGVSCR